MSEFSRETLLNIIETDHVQCGEASALARMALAAMDSEPVACGNGCNKSKWHKLALDIDEYMNGEDAMESKGRDEIYSEIILRFTRLDVLETILRNEIGLPYGSPIPDIAEKIYDIKRARIYSVVPDDVSIFEAAIEECKKCDSIDEHAWNHGVLAVIEKYESCRAAILQAGNSPAQAECTTGFESYLERAGRSDATSVIAISLVSIARRTAGLLRQLDFKPNEESENPIEVLLFDAEKVESDIKEMKKNRAAMFRPHSVGRYFYATWAVPDENGLLPCPFCGSHASSIDDRLRFTVRCQNKGCGFVVIGPGVPELQTEEEAEKVDWAALEQQAKDKWNGAIPQVGNYRENANSSTNNCREIPETSTNRSREHFISLCNEFWNWSEMDEVCAEDRGYDLRMEWDGKVFKHPVTQALWRMYQAAPQEVK